MSRKQKSDILLGVLIAVFVIVLAGLVWLLVRPSPTPPSPTPPPDAWSRIQANGQIVVGTSADYPPFAYYDTNFALTGFDIALMREIGQQLGVQVVFRDMAFDGLYDALQLQQIDAAISAISVTPEREQLVDFSSIYFVSEDGILARQDAGIAIASVNDMAPYRLAVQAGTVYERQAQRLLVDTAQMPQQNLFVYQQVDTAVADLTAGRVDLVWLDLQPAQRAVSLNGVVLAGQGLNRQTMAIAMQNGETALQNKLNEALATLQSQGRIGQLVLDYMGIPPDQILPPPTAVPSVTPVPTATPQPCVDGMRYVADLNLDDNNMQNPPLLQPGAQFQKGWRIQNTGTCTWQTNYYLLYVDGSTPAARMGGQATFVPNTVAPGQTVDMWVSLVSPLQPGVYKGIWALHNSQGRAFGDRIWVGIEVPAPATATPLPTQTPSPNIQFTANQTTITAGQCTVFNWNVTGATAVYFYAAGQNWQQHQVTPQGSRTECPSFTTTYDLRVLWPDGSAEVRQIVIQVIPAPTVPVIEQFSLSPPTEIFAGQCVSIIWRVSGNVTGATLLRNDTTIYSNAPVSGSLTDCPPGAGATTYSLVATGPGGTSRQQQVLNVILPATQPPPPTATSPSPSPTIDSFTVRPSEITQGECVNISWRVGGAATLIQIKRDGVVVLDNAGFSGVVSSCLQTPGTVTFRIEASGNGFAFQETQVLVQPYTEPGLPLVGPNWRLTDYWDGQGAVVAALPGTTVTAVFGTDNQLTGSGGCNNYSASYSLLTIPNSLTIATPIGANIFCATPEGIMTQEQIYLSTLPTITSYQINGNVLELRDSNGRVVLWFEGS
ncbi:MAG: transporter substrate-binding domain-containing protein [Anaerolineae bacterium]|nr:transporter substrate-binding domain-containing protein [Anaerolineae bacterium]